MELLADVLCLVFHEIFKFCIEELMSIIDYDLYRLTMCLEHLVKTFYNFVCCGLPPDLNLHIPTMCNNPSLQIG